MQAKTGKGNTMADALSLYRFWLEKLPADDPLHTELEAAAEDEEEIIRKYKEHLSAHFPKMEKVRIEQLYRFVKPGITDPNAESVQLLKKVAANHIENVDVHSAMFSCDMAAFTELGKMETVEFGPIGEHLHGPDEWVDVESLFRLSATIADFIVHWCG